MNRPFQLPSRVRWRLLLFGLPILLLGLWSARLLPHSFEAHHEVQHCTSWVFELEQFRQSFERLHQKGLVLPSGGRIQVEEAGLAQELESFLRFERRIEEKTAADGSDLGDLLNAATAYIQQVNQVRGAVAAWQGETDTARKQSAFEGISVAIAHLGHRHKGVLERLATLQEKHQARLVSAAQQLSGLLKEWYVFAGATLLVALSFLALTFLAARWKADSEARQGAIARLLERLPLGVLVWDRLARVQVANPSFLHSIGLPEQDGLGAGLETLLPLKGVKALVAAVDSAPISLSTERSDGSPRQLEGQVFTWHETGEPLSMALLEDRTESLRLARQLQELQGQAELGRRVQGKVHDLERVIHPLLLGIEMLGHEKTNPRWWEDALPMLERNTRGAAEILGQLVHAVYQDEALIREQHLFEVNACLWEQIAELDLRTGVELDVRIPDESCLVRGRREQFKEVIQAFLTRAQSLVRAPGGIQVSLTMQSPWTNMEIADSGETIPPDQIDAIQEGSVLCPGLEKSPGIPALRRIIESMGGELQLRSGPQGGTTVQLRLPLVEA